MKEEIYPPLPRDVTGTPLAQRILDDHHVTHWPGNISRFELFRRNKDRGDVAYRAVTWEPGSRVMYVVKLLANSLPIGIGDWERWTIGPKNSLDDAFRVQDTMTPVELGDLSKNLRSSSLIGMQRREGTLQAFCFVDVEYEGAKLRLFNPFVQSDKKERSAALAYVCNAMQQPGGYQTYILELFYRYIYFGAAVRAMARMTPRRGGPGISRVGINVLRPGRRTAEEKLAEARFKAFGEPPPARRGPVRLLDIEKFVQAIKTFHIEAKQSLKMTYVSMRSTLYRKYAKRLIPSEAQFLRHAQERLLEKSEADGERLGPRLKDMYLNARTGQSTHMTFGLNLEVVDVDGFVAKLPVRAMIRCKVVSIPVTIMFAVSRRSGAVVGYEIALEHENSEAFRRCIASVFMPKEERAKQLGLKDTRGLLHGNIDAIFVDNAGITREVYETACKEMRLIPFVAPPARGDLKATGESLNNIMIHLLAEVTGAYTRQRDIFSRELRRIRRADRPITVEQLEIFLLMAIQHVNRFAKKKHLRSETMREARTSIFPASIWKYYQKRRVGDQKREWKPFDIWLRFIPWRPVAVRGGKALFMGKRWSSTELKALYNSHMKCKGREPTLYIEVKRVGPYATSLQWRNKDGWIGNLEMVKEDQTMVGAMTWKDLELRAMDDFVEGAGAEPGATRSRNRLQSKAHQKIAKAEKERPDADTTVLHGLTVPDARKKGQARRDSQRLDDLLEQEHSETRQQHFDAYDEAATEDDEASEFLFDVLDSGSDAQSYSDDLSARLLKLASGNDQKGLR